MVWCGWYDFGQYIGVEFDKEVYDLFLNFNKNVGLTIPYKGIVFMSDQPTSIKWENGLLHSENGKSVEWADGYGYYNLRGVNLPEDAYRATMAGELTMTDIMKMKVGADQRAVMIQFLGAEELLKGMNAKLIATGKKYSKLLEQYGEDYCAKHFPYSLNTPTELYQVDNFMDTGDTEYCMKMEHPSIKDKFYIEWVQPEIGKKADADLAQATAFGETVEQYMTAIEA